MSQNHAGTEYPQLHALNGVLSIALEPDVTWYCDWKLYFGSLLWIGYWWKWITYGYHGEYADKAAMTLGLDFILLGILQHDRQYGTGNGFYFLTVIIFVHGILGLLAFWKQQDIVKRGSFEAGSLYQDVYAPFVQILFLFIGQVGLVVFYGWSLFNNFNADKFNYVYWVVAYFAMQMSAFFNRGSNSMLGHVWPCSEWHALCISNYKVQYSTLERGKRTKPFTKRTSEMWLRAVMGFLVNMTFRDFLAFTVPVLVMQFREPLNFVVYCIGANFIVTLDDANSRTFDVHLREEWSEKTPPLLSTNSNTEQLHMSL